MISKINTIEQKWSTIKEKSKNENYDLEELDYLTCDLIAHLTILTERGIEEINGVTINTYKSRVWNVVENIGLLPEYREDNNEFDLEVLVEDKWGKEDNDFDEEIDDNKFYKE
jgi:hypothetical protein